MDRRPIWRIMFNRPVPFTYPQVSVVVIGPSIELTRWVSREDVIPTPAPNIVERCTSVGPAQRNAWVLPQDIGARRRMNHFGDLSTGPGDDRDVEQLAAQVNLVNTRCSRYNFDEVLMLVRMFTHCWHNFRLTCACVAPTLLSIPQRRRADHCARDHSIRRLDRS